VLQGLLAPEEDQAHRRRHGKGDDHRDQQRQTVGEREWLEERAGQPIQHEDRQHGRDLDQGGVDDRAPHLHGGFEDDPGRRPGPPLRAMFTQAPNDVLDVDDRVVDDVAQSDHQSGQDHGVDRDSLPGEHEAGADEG
jgi:hypothetical protein